MSSTQDQPNRDPRTGTAGTAGPGTAGTAGTAGPGTAGTAGTTAAGAQQAGAARGYVPRPAPGYDDVRTEARPRGLAAGLTIMAAVLMMLSGIWGFLEGLAAVIRGSFFVVGRNYAYEISVTGWGWIHLILGVVVFAAGVALLTDKLWARIAGVVLATFSAIANFMFIPYYPVWSIVLIAIDLFVIWALLSPRREWA